MARNRFWVTPAGTNWAVKLESRVLSTHIVKTDAIAAGQKVAKANPPSQLIVMRRDGTIEYEWTYGSDPYPPLG